MELLFKIILGWSFDILNDFCDGAFIAKTCIILNINFLVKGNLFRVDCVSLRVNIQYSIAVLLFKIIHIFAIKAPSQIFDWVKYRPPKVLKCSK